MKRLFYIGLFLCGFNLFAQQDSSVVVSKTQFNFGLDEILIPFDTNLNEFYRYQIDGFSNYVSLGNTGSALSFLNTSPFVYGFNLGEYQFDSNYSYLNTMAIYDTKQPLARISYISGPKKIKDFNVFFTQNINSRMNFAFSLKSFGSDGFYLNQQTKGSLFTIQNSFKTVNTNYGYFTKFTVISGFSNENGGIKGDSLFGELIQDNKLGVQVWLEFATNRYDKRKFEVHQYFNFNQGSDSNNSKSISSILLSNVGSVDDIWYEDSFTDSLYYDQLGVHVQDSFSMVDRSHLFGLRNSLYYRYLSNTTGMEIKFGVNSNGYVIETIKSDTQLFETSILASINALDFGFISVSGSIEKGIIGFNENGYSIKGGIQSELFAGRMNMVLGYENMKQLPEFRYLYYEGSNLAWDNNFDYIESEQYIASFKFDSLSIDLHSRYSSYSNYVYFGFGSIPIQHDAKFSRIEIGVSKNFSWKSFHFDVDLTYQEVSNNGPMNVAKWIGKVSVYHQRYLFKDALELRYGIDYWQTSAYTGDYYAPFSRSFVYQESYTIGNYPFINFYISARIKGAQGFINFQNIGQTILKDSYMMSPYYPMQDFGMSFGIRWDFYN